MNKKLELSKKQCEFVKHANKRWNGKIGATRCGKTFLDFVYTIPSRILERKGMQGINFILGVSKSTIERNVLEPMRKHWGDKLVTTINSENIAKIFGEKVYCLGAEKVSQVSKLRGAEAKYIYWDELVDCNEEVFNLAKSRLSLSYSVCDFTGNPANPNHWLKKFIDNTSDKTLFIQNWSIYDNPFLPPEFVQALEEEYAGTVYYDRYILGLWKRAEGIIYRKYADNQKDYILNDIPKMFKINIGVDFGGNGSKHTFVATGFGYMYAYAVHLESERIEGTTTPDELEKEFVKFVKLVIDKYGSKLPNQLIHVYCDSAEQVLIRGLKQAAINNNLPIVIKNALKMPIKQRIALQTKLFGLKRLFLMYTAKTAINAYAEAVYNTAEGHEDERLDNGTTDIDTLDAAEYSLEPEYKQLLLKEVN